MHLLKKKPEAAGGTIDFLSVRTPMLDTNSQWHKQG